MDKKVKIVIASIIILLCTVLIIICMIFKNKTYTVTFNTDGGSIIEVQKLNRGEQIIKPLDPEKEGYEFMGWYLDGKPYYFDTTIKDDVELVAKWQKKTNLETITVTFNTDGGSKISSVEIEKGSKLNKPKNPTKEGFIFVEWLLDNNSFNFDVEIKNDITLTAKWEKVSSVEVNVTFNSNGGSSVATKVIKKGGKITKPTNPTRTGYTFNGWYLDNKLFNFNDSIEKSITLTANWIKNQTSNPSQNQTPTKPEEVKKYTVTFNSNGGSSIGAQTITAGGKATKPKDPTREGFTFINWTHNGGAYDFNQAVNGNIILVANWEVIPVPDIYTVSLEVINGQTNIPERKAIVYKNGSIITATQLLNQDGELLGKYIQSLGAIRVNKAQYDLATSLKVKLSDGSVVSATKN